jgi:hypothetical protein
MSYYYAKIVADSKQVSLFKKLKYFSFLRFVLLQMILHVSKDPFPWNSLFSLLFHTDDEDITIRRKARKYIQVDATSPPCSLDTTGTGLWERQISLLFICQTTWHYIPEGINLHKPFILLLTAFIFLSSSFQSPMVQNRSAHKGTDLWIYDRVSICFHNGTHDSLERRWVLELFCLAVKWPTSEFYYHHLLTISVLLKGFSSTFHLRLYEVFFWGNHLLFTCMFNSSLGWKLGCRLSWGKLT